MGSEASWRTLVVVFVLGTSVGLAIQASYVARSGDVSSLMHLGAESGSRPWIEADLGSVSTVPGEGHDGQFSYVQARAPFDRAHLRELTDSPAYRHRRLLYPLLAGGFGTLSPWGTFVGLVLVAAAGFGLLAAATFVVASRYGTGPWGVVAVIANLGILESLQLLTSDALAFGLAMSGVALWLDGKPRWATLSLMFSVLTKETYLLVALALAGISFVRGRPREGSLLFGAPTLVLALWTVVLAAWFPGSSLSKDAIGPPLLGLARSVRFWSSDGLQFLPLFGLVIVVLAPLAVRAARSSLLTWLTLPWVTIAVVSSTVVWIYDGSRAFAPLATFAVLALGMSLRGARSWRHVTDHPRLRLRARAPFA